MKRREFLKAAGVGCRCLGGCRAGDRPVDARNQVADDGELAEVARYALRRRRIFRKRVAEITDNKFQIQVFAAGEIVPGLQVLDAVQNGTVEMGHTALYYYFGKDPAFTFGTALPFGLNGRQMMPGCTMRAATSCSTSS